jgi:hypothetical protein
VKTKLVGALLFGLLVLVASATPLLAQTKASGEASGTKAAVEVSAETKESIFNLPDGMVGDLFATLCFGTLAVALIVAGYKIFDLATPGIHFEQHVSNGNISAAIVFASMILGLSYVVAHVISAIIRQ